MLHSFRLGDGRSYGIHRGKLVDGDMRGANDHRGGLRALASTRFGHLPDFDMGGRVCYSLEEAAGTSGEPGGGGGHGPTGAEGGPEGVRGQAWMACGG